MKTKVGISVGLFGAALYFTALFGGYVPVFLLAGYVLLVEENEWLRKTAVKAVALMIFISFVLTVIGLIPDLLSWINTVVYVFKGNFEYSVISNIINVFTKAIGILRTCLFLLLGLKALNQGTIAVPFVDQIVNKYF